MRRVRVVVKWQYWVNLLKTRSEEEYMAFWDLLPEDTQFVAIDFKTESDDTIALVMESATFDIADAPYPLLEVTTKEQQ